jgi:hypothetical protein
VLCRTDALGSASVVGPNDASRGRAGVSQVRGLDRHFSRTHWGQAVSRKVIAASHGRTGVRQCRGGLSQALADALGSAGVAVAGGRVCVCALRVLRSRLVVSLLLQSRKGAISGRSRATNHPSPEPRVGFRLPESALW